MKILHVSKKYPQALGGDAVVVFNLRKQQETAGHKVVVVTSNCNEIADAPHVYKFGLRDTPANLDAITLRRIISLCMLFCRMFAILRHERPDVIHTHSIDIAFVVSVAARYYGIPTVHTFHIVTFYDPTQSAFRRMTELWLAKHARLKVTTVPNSYDVKQLRKAGLPQTMLLPNGVDLPFWQAYTDAPESEDFTFVAVGRLERQKGFEHLVRASSLLAHTLPASFQLVIAGAGTQESDLRALIKSEHVDDCVTLAGRKSPEEIRKLFARADTAVFPSLYETTPITVLEAWAANVPVIVSSVGILRDVPANFDAAYVVPPGDEEALAEAMSNCITDSQHRMNVAAHGAEEAERYAWPKIALTAESIYRSIQQTT